jgi:hypothetical protein
VASTASSQIDFSLGAIDGLSNVLGQTNYFYSGTNFISASVELDSGEGWHVAGSQIVSNSNVNLFEVALHEIGHAIGLGHYNAAPAVMNAYLDPAVTDLTQGDIAGAQAIYGPAPALVSLDASSQTTLQDVSNQFPWSEQELSFEAQGRIQTALVRYDDGSVQGATFDAAGNQPWSSQNSVANAAGQTHQLGRDLCWLHPADRYL